jgi:hypothetical protein
MERNGGMINGEGGGGLGDWDWGIGIGEVNKPEAETGGENVKSQTREPPISLCLEGDVCDKTLSRASCVHSLHV